MTSEHYQWQLLPPRFWSKVDITDGCWLWCGAIFPATGYGAYRVDGQTRTAHSVAYEALVGPVPAGLEIDHLCRTRPCVRPKHLEPVTHRENMRRYSAAKTHCVNGHLRTPENTYFRPNPRPGRPGESDCGACRKGRYVRA